MPNQPVTVRRLAGECGLSSLPATRKTTAARVLARAGVPLVRVEFAHLKGRSAPLTVPETHVEAARRVLTDYARGREAHSRRYGGVSDGRRLRMLRTKARLSQARLAEAVGVSQPFLSDLERGTRPVPDGFPGRVERAIKNSA